MSDVPYPQEKTFSLSAQEELTEEKMREALRFFRSDTEQGFKYARDFAAFSGRSCGLQDPEVQRTIHILRQDYLTALRNARNKKA